MKPFPRHASWFQVCLVQATGRVPDSDTMREGALRGLLLVGDLNLDPSGRKLPWPLPSIGFGNAAHLANATIN